VLRLIRENAADQEAGRGNRPRQVAAAS
jgi:hypothetical protein